jgi:hypothetical protein
MRWIMEILITREIVGEAEGANAKGEGVSVLSSESTSRRYISDPTGTSLTHSDGQEHHLHRYKISCLGRI